jgi:predicted RNase H-like HicB family nuclease
MHLKRMIHMTKAFNVIIERDSEGYYVATVSELRGCHTQAKSLDTLMKRIREAIELCLEVEGEEAEPREFVGVQRLWVEV